MDWRSLFASVVASVLASAVAAYGVVAFTAGQYVYQLLNNTDRIIVLEDRVTGQFQVISAIQADSMVNAERFKWIKEELERIRDTR